MAPGKNWTIYFLMAVASKLLICAQDQRWNRQNLPVNDTRYPIETTDGTAIHGEYNEIIENTVKRGQLIIYKFNYTAYNDAMTAVRIHVSAPNGSKDYPVLFNVRQQRLILSWEVPLLLKNVYNYHNVSRTLCPVEQEDKRKLAAATQIVVEVSTASIEDIHFALRAEFVERFELAPSMWHQMELTPPEPKYFRYTFPEGIDSVVVKVESDDQSCLLFSIQSTKCPVFDLIHDVAYSGKYQTVTKKGAITVTRAKYPNGQFFVVLVVTPNDFECLEVTLQPQPENNTELYIRNKKLQVMIQPSVSESQYLRAGLGVIFFFVMFYVIALCIAAIYARNILKEIFSCGEIRFCCRDPPLPPDNAPSKDPVLMSMTITVTSKSSASEATNEASIPPETLNGAANPAESGSRDHSDDFKEGEEVSRSTSKFQTDLFVSDLAHKNKKKADKKYRLYWWSLIPISIFYALPVVQLVITYQIMLHETGNQDICYYNFYCARPFGVFHSFNNVYSNIGYVMLGLLFLILVNLKEKLYQKMIEQDESLEKKKGIPQHFGLFYAMGIALMMEGVLSGCYHVCPSYSNFQFDTTFMYMMSWLCMLKIYQSRHPDINPNAHVAYFAITFVIFLAVIGMVHGTLLFWILFAIVHILLTLFISKKIYYSSVSTDISDKEPKSRHWNLGLAQAVVTSAGSSDNQPESRPWNLVVTPSGSSQNQTENGHWNLEVTSTGKEPESTYWNLEVTSTGSSNNQPKSGCWILADDVQRAFKSCSKIRIPKFESCSKLLSRSGQWILLVIGNLMNYTLTLYGVIRQPHDFASLLLSIFIINLIMYFAYYIIMKLYYKESISTVLLLFCAIALVTWGFAIHFFVAHLTSWQETPAISREGNKDCVLLDFYDYHDIWHILSSMGLFFSFVIILMLDDDLFYTNRDEIHVF